MPRLGHCLFRRLLKVSSANHHTTADVVRNLAMDTVNLTDAEGRLSELVDRAEAGESIDITRRGRPVARLTSVARPRKRIEAAMLRALMATMPPQDESAVDLVRSMRDGDRS